MNSILNERKIISDRTIQKIRDRLSQWGGFDFQVEDLGMDSYKIQQGGKDHPFLLLDQRTGSLTYMGGSRASTVELRKFEQGEDPQFILMAVEDAAFDL